MNCWQIQMPTLEIQMLSTMYMWDPLPPQEFLHTSTDTPWQMNVNVARTDPLQVPAPLCVPLEPWIHLFFFLMEKYCNKSLRSVSSCSVPQQKQPHGRNKQKIPITFLLLQSSESSGKCEVFMMTSELRNGVSFCLCCSRRDLFPWLWQTPFWRCVNCYNRV